MSGPTFKVLLVCTGNTCRSPMAEGVLKSLLSKRGVSNVSVSSAGVSGLEGMPATPFAIEAAKTWGIDISRHRARQLTDGMIKAADLILAMAPEHVRYILSRDRDASSKTYLIKAFPAPYSPSQEAVGDPIGGTLEDYNETFMELDEILRKIENKIVGLAVQSETDKG